MKRFAFVLAILTLVLPAACFAGPFGFDYGMTKNQVISLVGAENIIKEDGPLLEVAAAPKPDDNFAVYLLIFSPDQGLLKIIATGKTLKTSESGTELRVYYGAMRASIAKRYGAPTSNHDFLQPGAPLNTPAAFMDSLKTKLRVLACNWDVTPEKRKAVGPEADHITGVILETMALNKNAGWLQLTYEFEGFDKFYESMQKKPQEAKKN